MLRGHVLPDHPLEPRRGGRQRRFQTLASRARDSVRDVLTGDLVTNPNAAATVSAYTWIVNLAYYFLLEGFGGASLGKRMFGLRVTSADGLPASLASIAIRNAVFFSPAVLMLLLVLAGLPAQVANFDAIRPLLGLAFLAVMCSSMRRHNGWATLYDQASRTRVVAVAKAPVTARRSATAPDVVDELRSKPALRQPYGPFTAVSEAWAHSDGSLLWGFDPVLRRKVWIRSLPSGNPPIDAARRDTGREGRLFWLTGQRSAGNGAANWDAFEAPDGEPFLAETGPTSSWATVKLWLLQLAEELSASVREGSLPPLALDRVWVRSDGRLVLLDFPAPGTRVESESKDLTPVRLLWAVANHGLRGSGTSPLTLDAIPLHARALVNQWSGPEAPSLEEAHRYLRGIATAPSSVTRWRRAVPIAVTAAPIVLLVALALTIIPTLFRFIQSDSARMLQMIESLHMPNPPASSNLANPEFRRAFEIYLVGTYGAALNDDALWNSTLVSGLLDRRATAIAILQRHPNVSAEELARAAEIVGPNLERSGQRADANRGPNVAYIIVGSLAAFSTMFVVICCLVSSALLPGGIGARLLGLAVVTHDGAEIGRIHSIVRSAVAWLPAIVWLVWVSGSPRIQGFVPTRAEQLWPAGVAIGVVFLGALWAVVRPTRGVHDRLFGTWVVPR